MWLTLLKSEGRRIIREPFLFFVLLAPFLLGIVIRVALPAISVKLATKFDLTYYYPLVIALFVLTPTLYNGMVMAFQVLEEKDEQILLAVAVTPFNLRRYFVFRTLLYTLISIPVIVIVHELIGLTTMRLSQLWAIALLTSLNTPLIALFVSTYAKNQIEGFALIKGIGMVILVPLAMFFVPDYWHLFSGFLPSYWPIIAFFTAVKADGSQLFFWLAIAAGLVVQLTAVLLMYRKFEHSIGDQ